MNFLNPAALFGLFAAAIPVVIHLLSRRRVKVVAFPSIEFLERMKTSRMKRLRLKQMLLLLLRTLIIAMVVVAFARPTVNGTFRRNARTSAVVIIDASASMRYVHEGEPLFRTAVRKAGEILAMFRDDDMVGVVLSAGKPMVMGTGMLAGGGGLPESLDDIDCTFSEGSPTESFSEAVDMLSESTDPNKEIFYITDGALNSLPDSLPAAGFPYRVYAVLVGPEEHGGTVVESIGLVDRLVSPGKPVTFRVRGVIGHAETDADVEFFVNGERKGRVPVVRGPDGRFETTFSYTPESPGRYSVWASVDDGRYEPGETRRTVLCVPERVKVLVVGETPGDFYYLDRALDPDGEGTMFLVRNVLRDALARADVAKADIVVLNNVESLSPELYDALVNAVVQDGKGLLVFPPDGEPGDLYETGVFRDVFPAEMAGRVTVNAAAGGFVVMDRFDMTHPVLAGISTGGKFHRPEVKRYIRLRPTGKATVLARYSDGYMAVGETACGRGRVILFTVDLSAESSELPMSGIFIPLLIRAVQHLSGSFVKGGEYVVGDEMNEFLGEIPATASVMVKPGNRPARSVEIRYTDEGARLGGGILTVPDFYSVMVDGKERGRFCVNVPVPEVVFERYEAAGPAGRFESVRWKSLSASADIAEQVVGERYGSELFGLFLFLAGLLLAVEMILSRKA